MGKAIRVYSVSKAIFSASFVFLTNAELIAKIFFNSFDEFFGVKNSSLPERLF